MAISMLDFTVAFPKKVNIDQYKPLIDAALNAAKGEDGLPRVVVETCDTAALAARAANAIRRYSKENKLNLRVSCPEKNKQSILVYKANPRARKAKDSAAKSTVEHGPSKN